MFGIQDKSLVVQEVSKSYMWEHLCTYCQNSGNPLHPNCMTSFINVPLIIVEESLHIVHALSSFSFYFLCHFLLPLYFWLLYFLFFWFYIFLSLLSCYSGCLFPFFLFVSYKNSNHFTPVFAHNSFPWHLLKL